MYLSQILLQLLLKNSSLLSIHPPLWHSHHLSFFFYLTLFLNSMLVSLFLALSMSGILSWLPLIVLGNFPSAHNPHAIVPSTVSASPPSSSLSLPTVEFLGELVNFSLVPKLPTHPTLDTWVLTSPILPSTYHFSFCFQAHRVPWNHPSAVVNSMLNHKTAHANLVPSFTQMPLKRRFTFLVFLKIILYS